MSTISLIILYEKIKWEKQLLKIEKNLCIIIINHIITDIHVLIECQSFQHNDSNANIIKYLSSLSISL